MAGGAGPRVLVAGIGNVFATDDGFGPEVARQLAARPQPEGVRDVDYGIRGLHLAYDLLHPWGVLGLVDALPDRGAPGRGAVLEIGREHVGSGGRFDAHGMDPATVLVTPTRLGPRLLWWRPSPFPAAGARRGPCWSAARSPTPARGWGCPARSPAPSPRRWTSCTACWSPSSAGWAAMSLGIPGRVVEMVPGYGDQLALVEVEGAA